MVAYSKTIEPELVKAFASFRYYLFNHVFIREVLADGTTRTTQFEHWPIHDQMISDVEQYPRLVKLKARQISITSFLAALHVWSAMTEGDYLGGVISAGEVEAIEFMDKCRFIYAHLPYQEKPTLAVSNALEMTFTASGGKILGFPATQKAGIGFTFGRMVVDEAAFHPYAAQNYEEYEPATEHGQIIVVSSVGDEERQIVNDWFQRLWEHAPANGFMARFYGWRERPGRDEAWAEERRARLSSRKGSFERQYPSTPGEAFASMQSLRFDAEALEYGRTRTQAHKQMVKLPEGVTPEHLKVWAEPRPNVPYLIYSEAAEGKGKDYTVTTVAEARTLKVVARFKENVLEPEIHGVKARKLAVWYNMAYASWERNKGEGLAMAYASYPHIYYHEEERTLQQIRAGHEAAKRPGLPITESTRADLLQELAIAIETGALEDPDAEAWEEFGTFIVVEYRTQRGLHYRAQAAAGKRDDIVMCEAGVVHLAKQPEAQRMIMEERAPMEPTVWGYSRR